MEKLEIIRDIAERTGGDIYLGVVGPARTGKSTFIKRFMDLLVIPNIKNPNERDRARDELPQSGAGRTITTTEPKFIPNEAVEINIRDGLQMKVRLVDCPGYTVPGAVGYQDEAGQPRLVGTPWFEEDVPYQEAAEIGTKKVIADHSTIGIVVVTDGSITDLPRESYLDAEERVIWELKELGKPFVVLLNSAYPYSENAIAIARSLDEQYGVPVIPMNCEEMTEEAIINMLEEALFEFPVVEVNFNLPEWIKELDNNHWLRQSFETSILDATAQIKRLRDVDAAVEDLAEKDVVQKVTLVKMDLGTGTASIQVDAKEGLFYRVLRETTGYNIEGDHHILSLMKELSLAKKEYDKVVFGLQEVRNTGYGVITPVMEEIELEEPELIKQGGRFGVKLKASAPSIHLIKANITTEITPLIGTEKQCEDMVKYMVEEFEENPAKIWETNIFGKSLYDLVREGIQGKLYRMPENAQVKLQDTIQRIVNEGSGGLICIII
ncbi:MAG: stage IV sporulation protein A [Bacillota bacterium]